MSPLQSSNFSILEEVKFTKLQCLLLTSGQHSLPSIHPGSVNEYQLIIIIIFFIMITIICITQGRTAANALKLVALTVKQKCLKSPTKCFDLQNDLRSIIGCQPISAVSRC